MQSKMTQAPILWFKNTTLWSDNMNIPVTLGVAALKLTVLGVDFWKGSASSAQAACAKWMAVQFAIPNWGQFLARYVQCLLMFRRA